MAQLSDFDFRLLEYAERSENGVTISCKLQVRKLDFVTQQWGPWIDVPAVRDAVVESPPG